MKPTRPLLQATTATANAATAATPTRTRRRTATAPPPQQRTELIPPSRDLIGPPCPLSNLRPVYYAPLFPSLHSPSGWGDLAAATPSPLPSLWTAARGAAGSPASASEVTQTATTPAATSPSPPPPRGLPRPRKPHPYSLAEFPTLSTSSRSPHRTTPTLAASSSDDPGPDPKLVRLERVRQQLHAQDLEWRWARYRFDAFNQAFWTRMNERFLKGREAYLLAAAAARADAKGFDSEGGHGGGGGGGTDRWQEGGGEKAASSSSSSRPNTNPNPNPNPGVEGTPAVVDLAPFYAQHLAETKRAYADYNKQLWRFQAGLIWPAVRASVRSWRWRFEVWRAGAGRDGVSSSSSV